MSQSDIQGCTLLIVDDTSESQAFLFHLLTARGCKVLVASDGEEALEQVQQVQPDLILLDIIMPGIDGFETCRCLKADPKTRDIPVIFMTALASPNEKLVGFQSGAVDYVTKPINPEELLARIGAHVSLRRLHKQLHERNEELSAFARMVAHDLRGPLTSILGFAELLLEKDRDPEDAGDLEKIVRAGLRMRETIDALLLLANVSQKSIELAAVDTGEIIRQVLEDLAPVVRERSAVITQHHQWPAAVGHEPWLKQVWLNYISNGLKYGGDPPILQLGADADHGGMVRFWLRDNGPGIPGPVRKEIFRPFVRLDSVKAEGHGLGLSIVRRIVHRLGGSVGVHSSDRGSEFFFTLPRDGDGNVT